MFEMKKLVLGLFLGLFSGLTATAQQPSGEVFKVSLEECVKLALKNNYNRQSVTLNELSSQEVYKQSKMERLPNLNATLGETYTNSSSTGSDWSGNYSLNTGVTIYQGGSISQTIEKNKLSAKQATYQTTQYDNDLTIQVLQAFLTVLGNEELLRYQDAILNTSKEQVEQGKARFEGGEILESDYLLLKAQYADDQSNILETTISRNNSLNTLKKLMSLNLSQAIEIIYPDDSVLEAMGIMPTESEVISRSIKTMPDLRISDFNVAIAETGLRISRAAYAPTLSLEASIGSGHANNFSTYGSQLSDRLNQQIGLTLSIPIFNRGATKSKVVQSRIALQQAELELKQTELDLRKTLTEDYRSVVLAESQYKSSTVLQQAYLASFEAYRKKFEQGSITAVDLLQQQNNYISAMYDYIQNKYGFALKRKVLDVYMGEPVIM
jgi:outer membrane protein